MHAETQNNVVHTWPELNDLKCKKLWHQLSLKVLDIVQGEECDGEEMAKNLYSEYVQGLESKMNQSLLVEILYDLSKRYEDPDEALALLEDADNKMAPSANEARALCKILRADMCFSRTNDLVQCKRLLDEAEDLLDGIPITEKVHGRYYLLSYKWYKNQGNYSLLYRNGLRYLAVVNVETLSTEERLDMARTLAIAAMIADEVYNIGILISNPVTASLKGCAQNSWLYDLLLRMECGRVSGVQCYHNRCELQAPELWDNWAAVQQKVRLLCLMQNFVIQQRPLTLEEISHLVKLSKSDTEFLVMTAMAKDLIKGQIDEHSGVVSISWIRPKVLCNPMLHAQKSRLEEWCQEVQELEMHVSDQSNRPENAQNQSKLTNKESYSYTF